jgi:AbrB family looped-hinge helix DNA binding protein
MTAGVRPLHYELAFWVIQWLLMRSTITSRGQTVIPAAIRQRFGLGPSQRLEWLVEADDSIRVIPVAVSPIQAFRGQGKRGGSSQRLLADRQADASLEA